MGLPITLLNAGERSIDVREKTTPTATTSSNPSTNRSAPANFFLHTYTEDHQSKRHFDVGAVVIES